MKPCERCYTMKMPGSPCMSLSCIRHREYHSTRIPEHQPNQEQFSDERERDIWDSTSMIGTLGKGTGGGTRIIRSAKNMT